MRINKVGLLLLAWLPVTVASFAQMTPRYDSYTTYSIDPQTYTIYQTVVVEGITVGSCTGTYQYYDGSTWRTGYYTFPGCSTAAHTPTIKNRLGGVGGTTTGPSVSPFSFLSYQTTTAYHATQQQFNDGTELPSQTEAIVTCSVVGSIFDFPIDVPVMIGGAYTKEVSIGPKMNNWCSVAARCTNTPLCLSSSIWVGDDPCSPGWHSYFLTYQVNHGLWHCVKIGASFPTSDTNPEHCVP